MWQSVWRCQKKKKNRSGGIRADLDFRLPIHVPCWIRNSFDILGLGIDLLTFSKFSKTTAID